MLPPPLSKYADARQEFGQKMLGLQSVLGNIYSKNNPEGIVNLAVAENSLMWDELVKIFEKNFKMRHIDFTYGDSMQGSVRLRQALASLFNSEYFKSRLPVQPDDLIIGSGLLSVMSQLFRALVDPGHGILLAEPYYYAFDIALDAQTGVKPVGVRVPLEDMFTERELVHFEDALVRFNESNKSGSEESGGKPVKIQAIILCNPQNPLGRCYPPSVIQAYAAFAEKHNLHLVSDEIYALSTFTSTDIPNPDPFTSILATKLDGIHAPSNNSDRQAELINVDPERIHMIYGMSKDFDSNGLRVGVLHTKNKRLMTALVATNLFMLVGSPSSGLWWSILQDKGVLDKFIGDNQEALKESYEHMTSWFKFHHIPYHASQAGHFVMANLRPFLDDESLSHVVSRTGGQVSLANAIQITAETSFVDREQLLSDYWAANRVLVARGTAYHMHEPGWYRLTFCVNREVVDIGLRRIERAMGWKRWDKLCVE